MNSKLKKLVLICLAGLVAAPTLVMAGRDNMNLSINIPGLHVNASVNNPPPPPPPPHNNKNFHWVNVSAGQPLPPNTVVGGGENGHPLFVCHGHFNNGVYPGKVVNNACNITAAGREQVLYNYQVLVSNYPMPWIKVANGHVPPNAVQGGHEKGQPLFICQADFNGSVHTGKVAGNTCRFGYAGNVMKRPFYRVLVR